MIGDRFVNHLKSVPPRYLSKLNLFLEFLSRKNSLAQARANHLTPNGYGSRLLESIIKLSNLKEILTLDSKDLSSYLLWIRKDLEKPIDVRQGNYSSKQLFIKSTTLCHELMTIGRTVNPLLDIPFEASYADAKWQKINPFRICDMGTTDLKFDVHTDYLYYRTHGPTYAVYSLDVIALVAKFVAYTKTLSNLSDIDQIILDFIHQEIIIPTLLNDSLSLWLRNIYKQQFLSVSPLESYTSTIWDVTNIDTIGSDFNSAMEDVLHIRQDLKNQSITYQTALSSLPLSTDGESFTNYYKNLYTTTSVPNEQAFLWVDCLKNLMWWEFILITASFMPNHPDVLSLKRDALRDLRLWMMLKPWQNIHNSIPYQISIKSKLQGLYTYLSDR